MQQSRKRLRRGGRKSRRNKGRVHNSANNTQQGNLVVRDSPRFPNDIKQIPIHNRVIRFYVNGAATQATTPLDLLSLVGTVTNGSTTYVPLYSSFRLRRVSMYFVPTSNLGTETNLLTFSWAGTQNAPDNLLTDRGTATQPACIKVRPIPDSLSSMWFDRSSSSVGNTIFTTNCPIGTILDIDFEFVLTTSAIATLTLSANATYTGGAMLTLYNGGAIWQPEGFSIIHT